MKLTKRIIIAAMALNLMTSNVVPAYAGPASQSVDVNQAVQSSASGKSIEQILAEGDAVHNYYTNVPAEGRAQADAVCKQIADSIMANANYPKDADKILAAAQIVSAQCLKITYGQDANKYYRSPYGVFVTGNYTCAGATRALGRILEYMGFSWDHMNENDQDHQWCNLVMDGRVGWADGQGGQIGFGAHDKFGLNYDINPKGNYIASNISNAEKIAAARTYGGDLLYYYYVPYCWSDVPESALASYNLADVDPTYGYRYTFLPNNTLIEHAHPENEPCHLISSATEPGDLAAVYSGEGTKGGVHYVDYTRTEIQYAPSSFLYPNGTVYNVEVTNRFYDSGIVTSTNKFTSQTDGRKDTMKVTMALR